MRLLALALALLLALPAAARADDVDYLVLVPRALRQAVEPLAAHRAAEGLAVRVVEVEAVPGADRRAALREVVRRARPRFLLIAGDVKAVPQWDVAETATDRPYGDLDDDGLPEVSVGRLPARDAAALSRMVARTVAYEAERAAGAWQRQCALVAGEGRFGPAVDALIEDMFQRVVARTIPARFDVDLTYANPTSPYCFPFEGFARRVVGRVNEGALVVAYVGHGNERSVDSLTVRDARGRAVDYPVLDASHVPAISTQAPPVMVAIACWTGRYEAETPCIGEELLATGQGPVAFFGSSRISHPVPNALLGISLVGALFDDAGDDRLGPRLDRARRELVAPRSKDEDPLRAEVLLLSSAFMPREELRRELPRHVDMYNLLGDPALRLARPAALPLEGAVDGEVVTVRGQAPAGARSVTVTLEGPRGRPTRPASAGETPLERYARANDRVLATSLVGVGADGRFVATLRAPAGAAGPHVVKALATAERGGAAAGAAAHTLGAPGAARRR
ncbi:MAG: C25 family cysteine peptidase [Planctomycetes bacterium]|nr:C25 family cysteine peptidase [Planctomycetota bacterium]